MTVKVRSTLYDELGPIRFISVNGSRKTQTDQPFRFVVQFSMSYHSALRYTLNFGDGTLPENEFRPVAVTDLPDWASRGLLTTGSGTASDDNESGGGERFAAFEPRYAMPGNYTIILNVSGFLEPVDRHDQVLATYGVEILRRGLERRIRQSVRIVLRPPPYVDEDVYALFMVADFPPKVRLSASFCNCSVSSGEVRATTIGGVDLPEWFHRDGQDLLLSDPADTQRKQKQADATSPAVTRQQASRFYAEPSSLLFFSLIKIRCPTACADLLKVTLRGLVEGLDESTIVSGLINVVPPPLPELMANIRVLVAAPVFVGQEAECLLLLVDYRRMRGVAITVDFGDSGSQSPSFLTQRPAFPAWVTSNNYLCGGGVRGSNVSRTTADCLAMFGGNAVYDGQMLNHPYISEGEFFLTVKLERGSGSSSVDYLISEPLIVKVSRLFDSEFLLSEEPPIVETLLHFVYVTRSDFAGFLSAFVNFGDMNGEVPMERLEDWTPKPSAFVLGNDLLTEGVARGRPHVFGRPNTFYRTGTYHVTVRVRAALPGQRSTVHTFSRMLIIGLEPPSTWVKPRTTMAPTSGLQTPTKVHVRRVTAVHSILNRLHCSFCGFCLLLTLLFRV